MGGKAGIIPVIAGQNCERDPTGATEGCERLNAIAPVIKPAETAHHNGLCPGNGLFRIDIHRERMAEFLQAGEAQGGQNIPRPPICGCKSRQIAVGERQHHHIPGRLGEIDGGLAFIKTDSADGQEVHGRLSQPGRMKDRHVGLRKGQVGKMALAYGDARPRAGLVRRAGMSVAFACCLHQWVPLRLMERQRTPHPTAVTGFAAPLNLNIPARMM
ncbi:hypothetical protein [Paracoccus sp. (in: a-proteobacteria)]|uniref:hypothetical protein n=1 Tax=Paracoccus sp. TaxID=267 RepID=UPI002AFDF189|nr:hypothetical protein [Paracoccus sp. (in: a-proteobacteria)]